MKDRVPISQRLVYTSRNWNEDKHIQLNVNGDLWNISIQFVFFKTDKKGVTYHLTNALLHPPLENYVQRLNHIQPNLKMTETKLTKLLKDTITKGVFEERDRNSAMIYLTLNSWLQLKPKTKNSKLAVTTPSRYRRLIKEEETILEEAHKHAKKWRR
jgi:hypothetical protein